MEKESGTNIRLAVERGELKRAVTGLGRIATGRSALPILGCARFETGPGRASASATDLEQSASFGFSEADTEGAGVFVVPMQGLKDVLKTGAGDTVVFETAGAGTVVATSGGVRLALQAVDPLDWPPEPVAVGTAEAPGFLEAYRRLLAFASTEETRHILNGVHVDVGGRGRTPVTMVATDGRRLTAVNSMALPLESSVVVPVRKFLAWTGLGADCGVGLRYETRKEKIDGKDVTTEVAAGLTVSAGSWTYQTRLIEGVFPNWRQIVPPAGEPRAMVVEFSEADAAALKTALPGFPGADARSPSVTLRPDDEGRVTLTGRGADDPAPSTLALESGSRFIGRGRIALNPVFLRDALAAGFRRFEADELSPLKSEDGRGGLHVLMPMRVEDSGLSDEPEETRERPAESEKREEPTRPEAETAAPQESAEPVGPAANHQPLYQEDDMNAKSNTKVKPATENDGATDTLDRFQSVADAAKAAARETLSALTELARLIKTIGREHKAQTTDLDKARQTLRKLRDISL
jgi:DNA polymerase III sliding clamp (beta) subunit (PCNA family)